MAVHIYTQTIHRTTQITTNVEECGPCPVFASFTLGFALQLRKKHGKTSVRLRKTSVLHTSSCKVPLILVKCQCKFEFSREILKKKILKPPNFMEIRPMGAELFHADRQKDTTRLIVAFRNFAKRAYKGGVDKLSEEDGGGGRSPQKKKSPFLGGFRKETPLPPPLCPAVCRLVHLRTASVTCHRI